jgi:hypothetical protein
LVVWGCLLPIMDVVTGKVFINSCCSMLNAW